MVQLRDEDTQSKEPFAHIPFRFNSRESCKVYLKQQLEDFLPIHDKRQDEFINRLPGLLFLPRNATERATYIYDELCVKRDSLIKMQEERVQINTWLWSFYREELPDVTFQQCRERIKQLYAGKHKFYTISKQVEANLYKLHAIGW